MHNKSSTAFTGIKVTLSPPSDIGTPEGSEKPSRSTNTTPYPKTQAFTSTASGTQSFITILLPTNLQPTPQPTRQPPTLHQSIHPSARTPPATTQPHLLNQVNLSETGYTFTNVPRTGGRGGGVGALVRSDLKLHQVTIDPHFTTFEHCIITDKARSVNYVAVYRPPPSSTNGLKTSTFLEEFDSFIDDMNQTPGKLLLLGDLNVHYDCPERPDVARVVDTLKSAGLKQYISKPTHRHGHTLDVVIAREDENLLCSIRTDPSLMSDHVAVSCMIRGERPSTDERPQEYRKFSNIDHTLFADDLASFLDNQPLAEDVNSCVLNLDRDMERVLDIHAPVCLRTTQVRHRPKWYNEEVDAARRERRRQERKWRKSLKVNPDSDRSAYCEAKAAAAEALSRAKRFYYNDLFSESTPKDMYRELKHLLNKSKRFLPDADSSVELASTFCTFFSEKIRDLRRCIDDLNVDELDNPNGMAISAPSFVEFQLVTSEEVQRLIKRSPNKTCPLDPLPTWLLKRHLPVLLPKLTHIINASLASGDFPSSLGVASVTPVLKKPGLDKERMKNYRPISNIRFVAKLMERVVSSQLANYLEDNSLGDPKQSAYRKITVLRLHCLLSGTTAKNIHRLQLLQNQSARLIFKQPKSTHTTPLLNSLHWLPIQQRVLFKTSTLVFKSFDQLFM
ncbi:uncharacterized protein LOC115928580 [Strongylocentrotus purpuratus]|uniref:Endonuclease/exonuclease/phosphatase domain-containing protein n=1 Tax=Strongylocentrotus purpuratus TaxID=7668 RepID=A0A7M7T3T7_STRPU|nr:uncharacterized protein LOC115928580 [Strongylocentrotus purpuratus]